MKPTAVLDRLKSLSYPPGSLGEWLFEDDIDAMVILNEAGILRSFTEEKHMTRSFTTPVQAIEALAKRKSITFAEAVDSVEGRKLYSKFKEAQLGGSYAPAPAPQGDKLTRQFAGDAQPLLEIESDIDERVSALLWQEGKFAPTQQDRTEALNRYLTSRPHVYTEYQASQRKAIGGG